MLTHEASTTVFRGHHCDAAPDFSALGLIVGDQITIQAKWAAGTKQTTLYQCADVTLVDPATYRATGMCFNGALTAATVVRVRASRSVHQTDVPSQDNNDYTDDFGGSGLSTAQKAGIAVGSVLGALLIGAAAFFGIRKYRKKAPLSTVGIFDDARTLDGEFTPSAMMTQKQLA